MPKIELCSIHYESPSKREYTHQERKIVSSNIIKIKINNKYVINSTEITRIDQFYYACLSSVYFEPNKQKSLGLVHSITKQETCFEIKTEVLRLANSSWSIRGM